MNFSFVLIHFTHVIIPVMLCSVLFTVPSATSLQLTHPVNGRKSDKMATAVLLCPHERFFLTFKPFATRLHLEFPLVRTFCIMGSDLGGTHSIASHLVQKEHKAHAPPGDRNMGAHRHTWQLSLPKCANFKPPPCIAWNLQVQKKFGGA